MNKTNVLGLHCLHDSSVTFIDLNKNLRIFELERFSEIRNCSLVNFKPGKLSHFPSCDEDTKNKYFENLKSFLLQPPETILCSGAEWDKPCQELIKNHFPTSKVINMGHHLSHCAGAFAFSGYDNALAISIDGGGYEPDETGSEYITSSYSVYDCSREEFKKISSTNSGTNNNFTAGVYGCIAFFTEEIKKTINTFQTPVPLALSYAGKLMGLVAYGKVRDKWVAPLIQFYMVHPELAFTDQNLEKSLIILADALEIPYNSNCLSGSDSYDLAATNQYVFEKMCFNLINPFIETTEHDVVFSGGCALNVLFNQKLKEKLWKYRKKLYIPPNPGDEGLSLGHIVSYNRNSSLELSPYCGYDINDRIDIESILSNSDFQTAPLCLNKIVQLLKSGKIGGFMMGYSEVGPRALGNRSILCDPSFENAKDNLNNKVKFREWFRPFAPICRLQDKDKYFTNAFASPFMSYSPTVREEFRRALPGIVHEDGTARLQTVTMDSHPFIFSLLEKIEMHGKIPVLLNTSLNIKGKPIMTSVHEAFKALKSTQMDFLVIEDIIVLK